jgi:hypothetical protein
MRRPLLSTLLLALPTALLAQNAPFELNVIYECRVPMSMKVLSCAGNNPNDVCDVQAYNAGKPLQRGPARFAQVAATVPQCHKRTDAEAKAEASGAVTPAPIGQAGAPAGGVGPGGFKVGDRVRVLVSGWVPARIMRINGTSFFVHLDNGLDISKQWPFEVFREGKLTAADHAAGQYDTHDRVQVLVNGKWAEGEIVGQQYNNYSIKVPGYTFDFGQDTVTTTPNNIRISTTPPPAPPAKRVAGQAPKAGLASCGGKIEGRYELVGGGGFRIVFRSGKATVVEVLGGTTEYECFTGGGQVILYEPGSSKATETLEINNDGTLQWELGAMKKMGN